MSKKRTLKKQGKIFLGVLAVVLLAVGVVGVFLLRPATSVASGHRNEADLFEYTPIEHHTVSLLMAGDALLHGAVYVDAQQGNGTYSFDSMMETLEPITSQYDLLYYNQETILGGTALGLSTYPQFNSPQEFGDTMVNLGFNLVSLANNHTLDRGEEAIEASHQYWLNQPVLTAGSYVSQEDHDALPIFEKNGITFGFLAYTYGTNGLPIPEGKDYLVNVYTEDMLKNDMARLRDQVDILLVSMHWGVEYTFVPTDEQRATAQLLADQGADVIIGSHPHVIEPMEWMGDTLVIYSLGNLISAQDGIEKRIGILAGVTFEKDTLNGETTRLAITQPRADLIFTWHDGAYHDFRLYTFDELNDQLLPDYQNLYQEYTSILTSEDDSIQIGGIK